MPRIGFFGTPSLAASVLTDILDHSSFEVVCVVTNPDKPVGREQLLTPTPVKTVALEHGIPVFTPTKIRDNTEFLDILRAFECDYFIVVAYGRILPKALLEIPKEMCINIHGSILPKYRGASPIQSALLHGEIETGVTIMQMSEDMDEGDILKIRTIPIDPTETSGTLFEKFAVLSGPTLIQTLLELEHGGITPLPQDTEKASYCTKIEKEDGKIDWQKTAKEIYQQWQAYTPWPGIYTEYEGKKLSLESVEYSMNPPQSSIIGMVTRQENGTISITCGWGMLIVKTLKLEGKKTQNIEDFIRGKQDFIGYIFP